jgi:hypothetical protein
MRFVSTEINSNSNQACKFLCLFAGAGTDSFTYRICNTFNACAQTTVTLNPASPPPNLALLTDLPAGYTGAAPVLVADRTNAAGTDCTEGPATALTLTNTITSPGSGQCTGPLVAGDYTLSSQHSDQLVFEDWTCCQANTATGRTHGVASSSHGVAVTVHCDTSNWQIMLGQSVML